MMTDREKVGLCLAREVREVARFRNDLMHAELRVRALKLLLEQIDSDTHTKEGPDHDETSTDQNGTTRS